MKRLSLAIVLALCAIMPTRAASLSQGDYNSLLQLANYCVQNDGVALYHIDSLQYDPPVAVVNFSMGKNGDAGEGRVYMTNDPQQGWICLPDVGGGGVATPTTLRHLYTALQSRGIQATPQRLRSFLLQRRGTLYRIKHPFPHQ